MIINEPARAEDRAVDVGLGMLQCDLDIEVCKD